MEGVVSDGAAGGTVVGTDGPVEGAVEVVVSCGAVGGTDGPVEGAVELVPGGLVLVLFGSFPLGRSPGAVSWVAFSPPGQPSATTPAAAANKAAAARMKARRRREMISSTAGDG